MPSACLPARRDVGCRPRHPTSPTSPRDSSTTTHPHSRVPLLDHTQHHQRDSLLDSISRRSTAPRAEPADVMTYLVRLAHILDVDLLEGARGSLGEARGGLPSC